MIVISLPHFIGLGLHGGRMDVRKEASPVKGFTGGSLGEVLTFRQATFPYDVSFRHKSRNAPDP